MTAKQTLKQRLVLKTLTNKKNFLGTFELLLAAFIWGSAFIAQSVGMDHIGPFTFQSIRFLIGGIVLLPVMFIRKRISKTKAFEKTKESKSKLLKSGVICGLFLTVAASFQQVGLVYTTPGKAGFLTTLYVLFVPLFSLFFKKTPSLNVWIAVLGAMVGLYLLCMNGSLALSFGDTLVFISALCYAAHIIAVDKLSADVDPIKLSSIQFLTVGIVSLIPTLTVETPDISSIMSAWLPILYTGILSSGVAYTLQVVAQRYTEPTIAAITMSFESVFAVICECLILLNFPSFKESVGCIIMFGAIVLAQLPPIKLKRS